MIIIKCLINSIWTIMSYQLHIDSYSFSLWQAVLLPVLMAVVFNLIFGSGGGDSN